MFFAFSFRFPGALMRHDYYAVSLNALPAFEDGHPTSSLRPHLQCLPHWNCCTLHCNPRLLNALDTQISIMGKLRAREVPLKCLHTRKLFSAKLNSRAEQQLQAVVVIYALQAFINVLVIDRLQK